MPRFTVKEEESAKGKVTECVPALGLEGFYDLPEHERRNDQGTERFGEIDMSACDSP